MIWLDPNDEAARKLDYIDAQLASDRTDNLSHLTDVRKDVIAKFPHLARPVPAKPKAPKPEAAPANGGYDPFAALFTG